MVNKHILNVNFPPVVFEDQSGERTSGSTRRSIYFDLRGGGQLRSEIFLVQG